MKRTKCHHAISPVGSHGNDYLLRCLICNTWWRLSKTTHTEGDWSEIQLNRQRLNWFQLHTTYRNEYHA